MKLPTPALSRVPLDCPGERQSLMLIGCKMVEGANRRKKTTGQFEFDENVLQTKGHILAMSLLLRLDVTFTRELISSWLSNSDLALYDLLSC
jgi:hypothetical protein